MVYTLQSFAEKLKKELETVLEDEIRIVEYNRPNEHKIALIRSLEDSPGNKVGQTFYVDEIFADGLDYTEADISTIVLKIIVNMISSQNNREIQYMRQADLLNFDKIKGKIFYTLINKNLNKDLVETMPHREFLGMYVVYKVFITTIPEGLLTAQINNAVMEMWGLDEEDLYKLASKNTPSILPLKITDAFGKEERMYASMNGRELDPDNMMHVLTNKLVQFGAAVIMYDGALKQVAESFGIKKFVFTTYDIDKVLIVINKELNDTELMLLKAANLHASRLATYLDSTIFEYDSESDSVKKLI